MSTENIVVVGGGYAGVLAAQNLEKRFSGTQYRVILIDKKSFFYHIIAGSRSAVEDVHNIIPYTNVFSSKKKNVVVQATVVRLEKNKLYLDKPFEGSTELPYAFAILAPGIRYPAPCKVTSLEVKDAEKEQENIQKHVKEASSILIVGGGPSGIELAGEIRDKYKDKKITLVHSHSKLLYEPIIKKAREQMLEKVQRNDVKVILDDVVEIPKSNEHAVFTPDTPLTTRKGLKLSADLVMLMFGSRAETSWLEGTISLSDTGAIKIKPTMQVDTPDFDNVYAVGDAVDIKELKVVGRARAHTKAAVSNIVNATKKKPATYVYNPKPIYSLGVSFGKTQGYIFTPFFTLGDWAISLGKAKTMKTPFVYRILNLPQPSKI
ncbi:hypothetical protein BJV82DRAFT_20609 [Fennellomyces sp. T-0311]|nr:hypothetical protein BJV82DRAFT_20609 [Fennellomyces sp. T-0311]